MDLVNELSGELAMAFLIEKKHSEKLDSNDVLVLIERIKAALQPLSIEGNNDDKIMNIDNSVRFASH